MEQGVVIFLILQNHFELQLSLLLSYKMILICFRDKKNDACLQFQGHDGEIQLLTITMVLYQRRMM